jgi:Outer membrane protein beta-barrel domain
MLARILGLALVLSVSSFLVASPAAASKWTHDRDGVVLGFNLGGGTAGINASGVDTDREGGFGGNFRVAYAFSPEVAAGFEGNLWSKTVDNETWTFDVAGPAITYYPGAKGFFVRGGIGVGTIDYTVEDAGVTYSASDDGFGFLVAGGYEWRLTRKFALGPQVDYAYSKVNSDLSMNYVNFTLGLNWYF